jgi:hypothetical protein
VGRADHGLLRRRALGTEAVYRILDVDQVTVRVEVVRAPGLKPGMQLTFTREAAAAMERIAGESGEPVECAEPAESAEPVASAKPAAPNRSPLRASLNS